jgi:hypothetical protein
MTNKKQLPSYPWMKFYVDWLENPAFMRLSPGAVGTFTRLYLLAGKADANGLIGRADTVYSLDDLEFTTRTTAQELTRHLEELSKARLMTAEDDGWRVVNFPDEQGPSDEVERAKWRERQARHRAKIKNEPAQELERETEREKEKETDRETDIECHGDVTVTHNTQPEKLLLSVAPSDTAPDGLSLSSFFSSFPLQGELKPEIEQHFTEQVSRHGKDKVAGYLEYAVKEGFTWSKSQAVNQKHSKVAAWELNSEKKPANREVYTGPNGEQIYADGSPVENAAHKKMSAGMRLLAEQLGFNVNECGEELKDTPAPITQAEYEKTLTQAEYKEMDDGFFGTGCGLPNEYPGVGGTCTMEIFRHFREQAKKYGMDKTSWYLVYAEEQGFTWSKARGVDIIKNMVKNWKIPAEE